MHFYIVGQNLELLTSLELDLIKILKFVLDTSDCISTSAKFCRWNARGKYGVCQITCIESYALQAIREG